MRASPLATVITERDSDRVLEVNAAFEALFKVERNALLGQTLPSFWREPEQRERLRERVRAEGSVRDQQVLAHTQRGDPLVITLSAETVRLPESTLLITFAQDSTALRSFESAWRESEEKFIKTFRASPYSISIVDLENDRYLDVNEGFERLFGRRRDQIIGRPVSELAMWADPEGRQRYVDALRRDGYVHEMPTLGRRSDGALLKGLASGVLLKIGGRRCLITFAQDLTEQFKTEQAKREIEAQLREAQKLEALGVLAGGIAHDFNNVLGAIMAFTELIRLDLEDDPAAIKTNLDMLAAANQRAKDLVQQILTFSRRKDYKRRPVRIGPAAREALRLLRSTSIPNIELIDRIDDGAPVVLADPSQIHQVVMNLGTNAVHAIGPRPGRITVELRAVNVTEEEANQRPDLRPGPNVLLSVSDTGAGMDAETCSRMFEPFFTTKPPGEGTGLGLAVVHGIVRGHDAAIMVHSEVGVGTTIKLYFPEHPAELTEDKDLAVTLTRGRGESVLVVEDEPALRYAVARLLERLGYVASSCEGPEEALLRIADNPSQYDVVLTDLSMPKMTGVEMAVQMLKLAPSLRIVLMSGYSPTWTTERLRELGICQLLNKPITALELARSLRAALGQTRLSLL